MEMGADRIVDLEHDRWWYDVGQVDLVFDTIYGGDVVEHAASIVKPGCALVTVTFRPGEIRPDIRTVSFAQEAVVRT